MEGDRNKKEAFFTQYTNTFGCELNFFVVKEVL